MAPPQQSTEMALTSSQHDTCRQRYSARHCGLKNTSTWSLPKQHRTSVITVLFALSVAQERLFLAHTHGFKSKIRLDKLKLQDGRTDCKIARQFPRLHVYQNSRCTTSASCSFLRTYNGFVRECSQSMCRRERTFHFIRPYTLYIESGLVNDETA